MSIASFKRRQAPTLTLDANLHHRRLLYIFTYAAAIVALIILHLALDDLRLTEGLIGAVTAGFVYSYFVAPRFRAVTTYAVSLLATGLALVYYYKISQDFSLYGNYLGLLLGLLTALLAYKAFSPADHRFILMVCVIFLLFSSVASYDLKFMLLLPLFLVFSGISLYIANQIEVAVRVASTTGKASSPSLRFGIGWSFLAVLLRAILGLILLSVMAYVVTPHSSLSQNKLILTKAPSVNDPTEDTGEDDATATAAANDEEAQIGVGNEFDLTDSRRLSAEPRPVLQLKSHRAGYLRAQVYDVYTGSSWIKSPRLDPDKGDQAALVMLPSLDLDPSSFSNTSEAFSAYSVRLFDFPSRSIAETLRRANRILIPEHPAEPRPDGNIFSSNDESDPTFNIIRQELQLLDNQPPYYFAMYEPFRLENISRLKNGGQLDIPRVDRASTIRPDSLDIPHPKDFTYTVYSLQANVKPAQLAEVYEHGPKEIVEAYTQLPWEEGYDPAQHVKWGIKKEEYRPISRRLKNFAGQFALPPPAAESAGPPSVYDQVMAIYNHLLDENSGYRYSRQFQTVSPDAEITEAFLFGTREGYCRYFASAMAVLCRINGIPARVVSGYSPGSFSWIDNAYIYKASNGHAWVEVYFDGYGWIMFDPSPSSAGIYGGSEAQQLIGGIVDFLQDLFIIDPAGTQQVIISAFASLWELLRRHGPLSLLITALLAALVVTALLLQHRRRGAPRTRLKPENAVIEMYLAMLKQLARVGLRQAPGQTASAFLRELARQHGELATEFTQLAPVYQRAAYSGLEPSEADLDVAAAALSRTRELVARELQRSKSAS